MPVMSDQSNPTTPAIAAIAMPTTRTASYAAPRSGRSRGSSQRARLWLILIVCALRASDLYTYFGSPGGNKTGLLSTLIVSAIWTTALLAGVWYRQDWCRVGLIGLLFISLIVSVINVPAAFNFPINYPVLAMFCVDTLIDAGAAWALISVRDIRRYTSRASGSRPYGYG
jgi:hypothetical protein